MKRSANRHENLGYLEKSGSLGPQQEMTWIRFEPHPKFCNMQTTPKNNLNKKIILTPQKLRWVVKN